MYNRTKDVFRLVIVEALEGSKHKFNKKTL